VRVRGTILARGQKKTWELIDTKYDTKRARVWAKLGFTKFWSNYGSQNSGIRMKLYKPNASCVDCMRSA